MRIFLAGGAGAIGRLLVPRLVARGHAVFATTRRPEKAAALRAAGATPVVVDAFDAGLLHRAVAESSPEVVLHQLTDLTAEDFAGNARLRREGTRNLANAASAAGVVRFIAQSISWVYEPGAGPVDESTPLDLEGRRSGAATVEAVAALEHETLAFPAGIVLRYGTLYGPGTWYDRDGKFGRLARDGALPATDAISSFVHVSDAADAAVAALDWPAGVVEVVDDEPAAGAEWAPVFAEAVGGVVPVVSKAEDRGRPVSNARARALGLELGHPSWRAGFLAL